MHIQQTGHNPTTNNFNIIGREDQGLARTIKEAIYIRVNNPTLNRSFCKYNLNHIWDRVNLNHIWDRVFLKPMGINWTLPKTNHTYTIMVKPKPMQPIMNHS